MIELVIFLFLLVLAGGLSAALLLPLWPLLLFRAAQEARWIAGWRRLVRQGGGPELGAFATVSGDASSLRDEGRLVSPAGGVPCLAYWLEARGGALGLSQHREKEARPFVVRTQEGEIAVDPAGSVLIPVSSSGAVPPIPLSGVAPPLDGRLKARHIRWSPAAPLYLVEERIERGERCTVVGMMQRPPQSSSPYRASSLPVVGGKGPLLVAAMGRSELDRELRRRVFGAMGRVALFAAATVAGSAVTAVFALASPEAVLCGACSWTAGFVILGRFSGPLVALPSGPPPPSLPS